MRKSDNADDSLKYQETERLLPDDLKPIFKQIVEDYEFSSKSHFGRGYVSYKVLSDMVLMGWRPSAEPRKKEISNQT